MCRHFRIRLRLGRRAKAGVVRQDAHHRNFREWSGFIRGHRGDHSGQRSVFPLATSGGRINNFHFDIITDDQVSIYATKTIVVSWDFHSNFRKCVSYFKIRGIS